MNFKISRNYFLKGLDIVSHSIPAKTPMQYLTGVKMDISKDKISLVGSDSETIISYDLISETYECIESGNVLIPFATLYAIIQKLKDGTIEFTLIENQFHIKCGRSHFKLSILEYNAYPTFYLNERNESDRIVIHSSIIKDLIKEVSFCCSPSDKKPILTGVNINYENGNLECIATDSYRLANKKIIASVENEENKDVEDEDYIPFGDYQPPKEKSDKDFNITIPNKYLVALNKVIGNYDGDLELYLDENKTKLLFYFNSTIYQTRLLDGAYPNTSRLIGNSYDGKITFDRQELLDTLNRVSILSTKDSKDIALTSNIVRMNVKYNNGVEFTTSSTTLGEAREIIEPLQTEGIFNSSDCDYTIAFSSKFLIDSLNAFTCDVINIHFTDSVHPFIIRNDNDDTTLTHLLLPVKMD